MAQNVWLISYDIKKVDGSAYPTPNEMFRLNELEVPKAIKAAAEKIAERFDFPYVHVVAKRTEDGKIYEFTHKSDQGFRSEWTVPR